MKKSEQTEIRHILCGNRELTYELTRKSVKNVNLRIKPDGSVHVSANRRVPLSFIEDFIRQKQTFIFAALDKYEEKRKNAKPVAQLPPREYQEKVFREICDEIYPLFEPYGVAYPQIKIRCMTSRWGSCQPAKGIITLNSRLIAAPRSSIEYVVLHEFAHFIHPNHSKDFWNLVAYFMPDYKKRKKALDDNITCVLY